MDPKNFTAGSVKFDLPKSDYWQLGNGIQVYYYLNDELPVMQGQMYFRGGSLQDDSKIAGLASAVGSQMRAGSVVGISPAELDQKLTDLAANIESSFSDEFGSVSFFSLTEDFEEVFSIFSKVVKTPAFDSKRLELWKTLSKEGISRRRDKPGLMSYMAFLKLVYGENSPYADFKTESSINSIDRPALKAFHGKFVQPHNAILALSGSLPVAEAKKIIEKSFGDWSSTTKEPIGEFPEVVDNIKPGLYVLERELKQATVYVGHLGPKRHREDAYATKIFNRVFGHGGFSSVLFREIRSKLGLAYTVRGGINPEVDKGTFYVSMGTRAEQAVAAVNALLAIINRVRTELPSDRDFSAAKSSTEKSFVFKFADPNFIPQRSVILDLLGYKKDYDVKYLSNISAVTKEQVLEVAKTHLNPEKLVIVIVGKVSAEDVFKEFGSRMDVYRLSFENEPKVVEQITN